LAEKSGILRPSVIGFTKEGTVIKFRCQSCAQKIAVNLEGAGAQIHCPTCGTDLTVPDVSAPEFLAAASALELLPPRREATALRDTDPRAPWWPHVAQWLTDRLTQTLFAQRRELLASQENTTARVQELEQRLVGIHEGFRRQVAGYQAQIRELEQLLEQVLAENQRLKYTQPIPPAPVLPAIEANSRRTSVVVSA
jgi:hypothetical protein